MKKSGNRLVNIALIGIFTLMAMLFVGPGLTLAATPQSLVTNYVANYGGNFVRSHQPMSVSSATYSVAQQTYGDGSIGVSAQATGYADSGFYLYYGPLGNLNTMLVQGSGSSSFGLNLWFDTSGNGDFFSWDSNNVMTGLDGDLYGLGPGSNSDSNILVNDQSTFSMQHPASGVYTLADLKNGKCSGIDANTKVAVWIGVVGSAAGTQATITSVNFGPPSQVWVNSNWATGVQPGTDVGSGEIFGFNAFATVQDGVNNVAPEGTVQVAAGNYQEQVTINKGITLEGAGAGNTTIAPGSNLTQNATRVLKGEAEAPGILVNSPSAPVTIENLTVDGTGNTITNCDISGVYFENSSGILENTTLTNWIPKSGRGSGHGIGVIVETGKNSGTASVTIENNAISDYGKCGVFAAGPGATVTVSGNTVTSSPTSDVATNGIEVDYAATGTVSHNTVTGNDYTGTPNKTDPQADYAAAILLYGASGNTLVNSNTLTDNQIGVETVASSATVDGNTITETGSGIADSIAIYAVPADIWGQYPSVQDYLPPYPTNGYSTTATNNTISGIPQSYGNYSNPFVGSAGIWIGNTNATGAVGTTSASVENNNVSGGYIGILFGPNTTGDIKDNQVAGFEKTGINTGSYALGGNGVNAAISGNTVTGAGNGNTDAWAQNGIEIANGGTGSITDNKVNGIIYTGSSATEATGILAFESSNVSIERNTVTDSQVGIATETVGYSSDHANWTMSGITVSGNTIAFSNAYTGPGSSAGENTSWGIWVASYTGQGSVNASLTDNVLSGAGSAPGNTSSIGIEIGDTTASGAAGSVTVTAQNNSVTGWQTGVLNEAGGTTDTTLTYNDLSGNNVGLANRNAAQVVAIDNWWGPNGPNSLGDVLAAPYLNSLNPQPPQGMVGLTQGSSLTVLLLDNKGHMVQGPVLANLAIPVQFASQGPGLVTFQSSAVPMGEDGTATASLTGATAGSAVVEADVAFAGQPSTLKTTSDWTVATGKLSPPPSQEVTRTLGPGWNTLSIPFVQSAASLSSLETALGNNQGGVVYAYQKGKWVEVTTHNEDTYLNQPMSGLYIDIGGNSPVDITLLPASSQNPPPTLPLTQGWNLAGPSAANGQQTYAGFLTGVSGVPLLVDPNGGVKAIPDPTLDNNDTVADGYAYWLYATSGDQTLVGQIPTGQVNP